MTTTPRHRPLNNISCSSETHDKEQISHTPAGNRASNSNGNFSKKTFENILCTVRRRRIFNYYYYYYSRMTFPKHNIIVAFRDLERRRNNNYFLKERVRRYYYFEFDLLFSCLFHLFTEHIITYTHILHTPKI